MNMLWRAFKSHLEPPLGTPPLFFSSSSGFVRVQCTEIHWNYPLRPVLINSLLDSAIHIV